MAAESEACQAELLDPLDPVRCVSCFVREFRNRQVEVCRR